MCCQKLALRLGRHLAHSFTSSRFHSEVILWAEDASVEPREQRTITHHQTLQRRVEILLVFTLLRHT